MPFIQFIFYILLRSGYTPAIWLFAYAVLIPSTTASGQSNQSIPGGPEVERMARTAEALSQKGDTAALYTLARLQAFADSTDSDFLRCFTSQKLGVVLGNLGRHAPAAEAFQQALNLAVRLDHPEMQVRALEGIADAQYQLLRYDAAVQAIEKAIQIADINHLEGRLPALYSNLAMNQNLQGNNLEAVKMFVKAANLYRSAGDSVNLAIIYNNAGVIFLDMKRYAKAIEYFKTAQSINAKHKQVKPLITNYGNLGLAYKNTDAADTAKAYFQKAIALARQTEDVFELSKNFYNMGNLLMQENRLPLAGAYFDSCAEYARQIGSVYALMLLDIARSEWHLKAGQPAMAKRLGTRALEQLKAYPMPYETSIVHKVLYQAFKASGDPEQAIAFLEQYAEIRDQLSDAESMKIIWEFEHQYEQEHNARLIAELERENVQQRTQKTISLLGFSAVCLLLLAALALFRQTKKHAAMKAEMERQRYEHLKEQMAAKAKEATGKALLVAQMHEHLDMIAARLKTLTPEVGGQAQQSLRELIRMTKKSTSTNAWNAFEDNLSQIHSELYKKLLAIDPRLTPTELKICGLIAQNLTTKDIAMLTNRNRQTIDNIRHTLRKKLNLQPDDNLTAFMHGL